MVVHSVDHVGYRADFEGYFREVCENVIVLEGCRGTRFDGFKFEMAFRSRETGVACFTDP
ncbi:hypothetical protein SAMN04487967_0286 [Natronorubrum sediminis]|uniref:Uncharacterized protein n=1 Tax=Natronorubrum sediminis TaxID=640943 RepID=A0A1H6FNF2_9EURY|nr:hypothetical protein SAMN04487967_0286 [Natronorubrum sediminis]